MISNIIRKVPLKIFNLGFNQKLDACYYHLASNYDLDHIKHICKYKSINSFEEDLEELQKNFQFVDYQTYRKKGKGQKPQMLLTFDDGYKELFTEVYPILKERKIPAIFFVVTNLIDNRQLLYRNGISLIISKLSKVSDEDWKLNYKSEFESILGAELKEKASANVYLKKITYKDSEKLSPLYELMGIDVSLFLAETKPYLTTEMMDRLCGDPLITIGAHTLNHPELFYQLNSDILQSEILGSVKRISELTGQDFIPFAFPYTSKGVDRKLILQLLRESRITVDLFGEPSIDGGDDIVIKRYSFDAPEFSALDTIKNHYIERIKKIRNRIISRKQLSSS